MGFGAQPHGGSPFGTTEVVADGVVKQIEGSISIGTTLDVAAVLRSRAVAGVIGINSALGPATLLRVRGVDGSINIVTALSVPGFRADLEGVITITTSLSGELTKVVSSRPDIEAMCIQINDELLTIYFDGDNTWPRN